MGAAQHSIVVSFGWRVDICGNIVSTAAEGCVVSIAAESNVVSIAAEGNVVSIAAEGCVVSIAVCCGKWCAECC